MFHTAFLPAVLAGRRVLDRSHHTGSLHGSVTIVDSFSSEFLSCSMSVGVIVTICWIRRKIFTKQIWYSVVSLEHSRGRLLLRQNACSIHFSLFGISSDLYCFGFTFVVSFFVFRSSFSLLRISFFVSSFCCLVLRFRCCESLGVGPTTFSSTRLGGVVHLLSSRLSACRVVRAALSRRGSRLEFSRLSQHRIFACRVVLFALRACTINYLFTFKYDLSFELET